MGDLYFHGPGMLHRGVITSLVSCRLLSHSRLNYNAFLTTAVSSLTLACHHYQVLSHYVVEDASAAAVQNAADAHEKSK
jgi:hypothetical protein